MFLLFFAWIVRDESRKIPPIRLVHSSTGFSFYFGVAEVKHPYTRWRLNEVAFLRLMSKILVLQKALCENGTTFNRFTIICNYGEEDISSIQH